MTWRVAPGVPAGGQYACGPRKESAARLDSGRRVRADVPVSARARVILDAIADAGGHGYLVGGCVRDALLRPGTTPKDVDIEAYGLEADQLAHALAGVAHVDEVGASFSVLTVRTGGEAFDVALPRTEARTGPGHRDFVVEPDPWADPASASARRDFTVNALMFDPSTGEVLDAHGGLGDLEAGRLRHTSAAFVEDPLRVLRGARFAAKFGFTMDPSTVELARSMKDEYAALSVERVWGEWSSMSATAARPSAWLDVLKGTGWLEHFGELAVLSDIPQDPRWHPEGDVYEHTRQAADAGARLADEAGLVGVDRSVVVLAAMLHDVGKATHTQQHEDGAITSRGHDDAGAEIAQGFLGRIGAPRSLIERVKPLVAEHMAATTTSKPTRPAVRRLARRLAPATMNEWALVVGADRGGRGAASSEGNGRRWLEVAAELGTQEAPRPGLLTGKDLIAAGMRPGPAFKGILAAALEAQDAGEFDDVEGARGWLAARG